MARLFEHRGGRLGWALALAARAVTSQLQTLLETSHSLETADISRAVVDATR